MLFDTAGRGRVVAPVFEATKIGGPSIQSSRRSMTGACWPHMASRSWSPLSGKVSSSLYALDKLGADCLRISDDNRAVAHFCKWWLYRRRIPTIPDLRKSSYSRLSVETLFQAGEKLRAFWIQSPYKVVTRTPVSTESIRQSCFSICGRRLKGGEVNTTPLSWPIRVPGPVSLSLLCLKFASDGRCSVTTRNL